MRAFRTLLSSFLLLCLCFSSAIADEEKAEQESVPCMESFRTYCARYSVPESLALAIARQESGFQPWAVNISGKSYFPASREEALALIKTRGKGRSYRWSDADQCLVAAPPGHFSGNGHRAEKQHTSGSLDTLSGNQTVWPVLEGRSKLPYPSFTQSRTRTTLCRECCEPY